MHVSRVRCYPPLLKTIIHFFFKNLINAYSNYGKEKWKCPPVPILIWELIEKLSNRKNSAKHWNLLLPSCSVFTKLLLHIYVFVDFLNDVSVPRTYYTVVLTYSRSNCEKKKIPITFDEPMNVNLDPPWKSIPYSSRTKLLFYVFCSFI